LTKRNAIDFNDRNNLPVRAGKGDTTMNTFFRRSINEYQKQISLKESFAIQTGRLRETLESVNWTKFEEPPTNRRVLRRRLRLLLLSPLIEIAWADGRVTRRESDAILQVAETYGLVDDETGYCELLDKLTARPMPPIVGRMWQDFRRFVENLSEAEREELKFCLDVQARFVAEQSSDNFVAFLRGERVSEREREFLQIVSEQLENACAAAKALAEKRPATLEAERKANEMRELTVSADNYYGAADLNETLDDYSKLIPLVPLVKTAWAEGRVTRRERELIFEAAKNMGIEPESHSYRRLSDWFELHPTDEFYDESLRRLRGEFEKLPEEERTLRRLDVLSDCVNVAEASGGTSRYPAGGAKICPEEIAVVKHIASRLNGAATV